MDKSPLLSGREVCEILARNGFAEVRRRGSHVVMQRIAADGATTTVPVPDLAELRISTLSAIIWQSGLPRGEFES